MTIQDESFVARYGNVDCDLSDDDGLNLGVDRCWGDSEQCAKYHPAIVSNACAEACAGDPDGAVATWFEVCNWQAVNALPETCAGTFAPSADALAAPSRNAAPVNSGVAVSRTFSTYNVGRFPLVSADFWTSDHLSERSRSVGAVAETRARGTLTLKRRCITLVPPRPGNE